MKIKVTAVFDIGKTNKKFFLFDSKLQEVHREYIRFNEITDEDGYPTENLQAIEKWVKEVFERMLAIPKYEIEFLNFSCYGASLVHINEKGEVLTPLYNYIKPLKEEVYNSFLNVYGPEKELAIQTGSPKLGMLNTGLHLYWLKYDKPEIFKKIKYSLHLPQYLSYLFTGIPVSEYTSIGCHTMLWNFNEKDYHSWVYQEKINEKLPPITSTNKSIPLKFKGKTIKIGVGIHDSSSALLPYIRSITKPFILVSTGTWSISINPFNTKMLSRHDIETGAIFNMSIEGNPVKVSRLFLGNEYKFQVELLSRHFKVNNDYHNSVKFNQVAFCKIRENFVHKFRWSSITSTEMPEETLISHDTFEYAYHQLMLELVMLQQKSTKAAIGTSNIKKLFVDGGFSNNEVYIQILSQLLESIRLGTTDASLGSALGAAIVISDTPLKSKFLKKNYGLKKHKLHK